MKRYILTSLILVIFLNLTAQKKSDMSGEDLIAVRNYPAAAAYFEKAVKTEPDNAEFWLKLGFCYLEMPDKQESAVKNLEKAVELSKKSKGKYLTLDAQFTLARAYHAARRFDDAIKLFNEMIVDSEIEKYRAVEEIEYEIKKAENAKKLIDNKTDIRVKRAPEGINSNYQDHSPFITGNNLYLTSKRKPQKNKIADFDGQYKENIYRINLDNPDKIEQVGAPFASEGNNAICWISDDESTFLFYRNESIWIVRKKDDKYDEPEQFKAVNSKYREPDAAMSKDGSTVYFSSSRPGGFGGLDIYKITKDENGKWSKPVNLGKNINTPHDENSPFIHDDGTLYFSSTGHNTMGGYDIFFASPQSDSFSEAQNMGYPTNSVADDIYYFLSKDKSEAYFSSTRKGSKGYTDIYYINYADSSAKYLVVEAQINTSGAAPENVRLSIRDINSGKENYNGSLNSEGKFELGFERGKKYYAVAQSEGYFPEAFTFTAPTDTTRKRTLNKQKLTPVKYENITKNYKIKFDEKSANLPETTKLFLNTIADFHAKNSDFVIDITLANSGNDKRNKKRSEAVVEYLHSKGIPDNKISVNLINYNGSEGDALLTIMDEGTRAKAYTKTLSEDGSLSEIADSNTPQESVNQSIPNSGSKLSKGTYVIQIAAFNKKVPLTHSYFKNCNFPLKTLRGKDGTYRYLFGNYKYKADAEKNLKLIKRKGFKDAFIRPTEWYDAH